MLQLFPPEVLELIGKLVKTHDLKQLCEVSKYLHEIFMPMLYSTIIIQPANEMRLFDVDVSPFLDTGIKGQPYVNDVQLRSAFHSNLEKRCIHTSDSEGGARFHVFETKLLNVFNQIRDQSLRSIRWEMGTCVPPQVLEYLSSKQSAIETVALITAGDCHEAHSNRSIDLGRFRSLRDISWTGLQDINDFNALSDALKVNAGHLARLHVDFVNRTQDEWVGDNSASLFAELILKLPVGHCEVMFPSLQTLSLGSISLRDAEERLVHALNVWKLSSLTLRRCLGSEDLLKAIVDTGQTIEMSSLEIICEVSDDQYSINSALIKFLAGAKGLKDLFVALPAKANMTLEFWNAVAKNLPQLARFVYHERGPYAEEEDWEDGKDDASQYDYEIDFHDLSFSPEDMAVLDQAKSQHPFFRLQLECLGLSCQPRLLQSILEPFTTRKTLKILHIRKSGLDMEGPMIARSDPLMDWRFVDCYRFSRRDFNEFADWVFGRDGVLSLQVLAIGDFSHNGRFRLYNSLFCRLKPGEQSSHTFRLITGADKEPLSLIDRNMDFLQACHAEPIMAY